MTNDNKKVKIATVNMLLRRNLELTEEIEKYKGLLYVSTIKKELLSFEEVREKYGISRSTFDRYRKKGLQVGQPIRNGNVYVQEEELKKFLISKKK